jgi:hypothetical protein
MAQGITTLLERFAASEGCWFGSVRGDGRPHSVPSWFVWSAGCAWFSSSGYSVHGRNARTNPHVTLHLPDIHEVILIEGMATVFEQDDRATAEKIAPFFKQKYKLDILAEMEKGASIFVRVQPAKVLAWGAKGASRWLHGESGWKQDTSFDPFG